MARQSRFRNIHGNPTLGGFSLIFGPILVVFVVIALLVTSHHVRVWAWACAAFAALMLLVVVAEAWRRSRDRRG